MHLHWCAVTVGACLSVRLLTATKDITVRTRGVEQRDSDLCPISHGGVQKKKKNGRTSCNRCLCTHTHTHTKNINGLGLKNLTSRCGMQIIVLKTLNVVFLANRTLFRVQHVYFYR